LQRVETGWAVVHLAEPQPDGAATKAFAGGAGAPKKWGLAHEWSDRLGAYDFDMPNASVHSEELMAAQVNELSGLSLEDAAGGAFKGDWASVAASRAAPSGSESRSELPPGARVWVRYRVAARNGLGWGPYSPASEGAELASLPGLVVTIPDSEAWLAALEGLTGLPKSLEEKAHGQLTSGVFHNFLPDLKGGSKGGRQATVSGASGKQRFFHPRASQAPDTGLVLKEPKQRSQRLASQRPRTHGAAAGSLGNRGEKPSGRRQRDRAQGPPLAAASLGRVQTEGLTGNFVRGKEMERKRGQLSAAKRGSAQPRGLVSAGEWAGSGPAKQQARSGPNAAPLGPGLPLRPTTTGDL